MSEPLSEVDLKILSDIVYLNIKKDEQKKINNDESELTIGQLVKSYTKDFYDETGKLSDAKVDAKLEDLRSHFKTDADFNAFKDLTKSLSDPSSKFYNWKVSHVQDNNNESGFVAYTFEPPGNSGQAVVAFRGSEEISVAQFRNDWINNVSSWYEETTMQQKDAADYMQDTHLNKYKDIAVTGHSLGGNLALYSTITADSDIQDRITQTYTYNAPGFNQEFIDTHKNAIDKLNQNQIMHEYQSQHDMVSSLFHNPTDPIIVKSTAKDPKVYNFDNHGLAFMAMEDGHLVLADQKDFACFVIQDITQQADKLPNFISRGISNIAVQAWTGEMSKAEMVAMAAAVIVPAAALVIVIGPAVAITMVAVAAISYLLPLVIEYYVMPFINDVAARAKDLGKQIAKFVGDQLESAFDYVQDKYRQFNDFRNQVLAEVGNFFDGIGRAIAGLFGGGKSKNYDQNINVNTAMLRNLAARLNMIQNKVQQADRRISTLRGLVDFDEMLPLLWLDMQFGFDYDLKACMDFLNKTADRLDQCEGSLVQKAHAF
ncbi:Mbeg1-like protein [Cohnella mopanensis]|uniref:Mbeg1-like protein n=1 Tax=Cohnella mopanensis TaxID=2911966 RepID=UPI001EF865E6|nr:Mbeg1-like protein [Cohnella mopanensis]